MKSYSQNMRTLLYENLPDTSPSHIQFKFQCITCLEKNLWITLKKAKIFAFSNAEPVHRTKMH